MLLTLLLRLLAVAVALAAAAGAALAGNQTASAFWSGLGGLFKDAALAAAAASPEGLGAVAMAVALNLWHATVSGARGAFATAAIWAGQQMDNPIVFAPILLLLALVFLARAPKTRDAAAHAAAGVSAPRRRSEVILCCVPDLSRAGPPLRSAACVFLGRAGHPKASLARGHGEDPQSGGFGRCLCTLLGAHVGRHPRGAEHRLLRIRA